MNDITTILIADDHPIFRLGVCEVINASDRYNVVAEAEDGIDALEKIKRYQPDIALLDISMPKKNGLDVVAELSSWINSPLFVILSLYDDEVYVEKALTFGVSGYILKENTQDSLLFCLDSIRNNEQYLCPLIRKKISMGNDEHQTKLLSPVEMKVLMLVADLKTNSDISSILSVSIRTVENHRLHICKKLNLHGAHALTRYASKQNQEK